jgi:hypothetical protein
MTIGLTCRRTARKIKRLKETVLTISPDYADRPTPDFLALSLRTAGTTTEMIKTAVVVDHAVVAHQRDLHLSGIASPCVGGTCSLLDFRCFLPRPEIALG